MQQASPKVSASPCYLIYRGKVRMQHVKETDSRYAMAFETQTQFNRALEIRSREIDRLPNKIRKTIEMLVWYRNVPAAEPTEIEEQSQIEKDLPKQSRPQHYPARDEDISLEEFNRAIIEAVERHGLHLPPEAKEKFKNSVSRPISGQT